MKTTFSKKPAANSPLAFFIPQNFRPGLGWTPKTWGPASSAAELTRAFSEAGVLLMGGGHRLSFLSMPNVGAGLPIHARGEEFSGAVRS